ncbi:MAG: hypothetical protein ABSB42_09485 [Tepidisphaeraceae bacterium]|jgi:hypothetical protein
MENPGLFTDPPSSRVAQRPKLLALVPLLILLLGLIGFAWWTSRYRYEFFQESWYLNFWSFWLTATGAIVGTAAYWIAIWQIAQSRELARQAVDAASAANRAVEITLQRLAGVTAFVDLTDLCAISSSVCIFLRTKKYELANDRLSDLRRAMARVQPHVQIGLTLLEDEKEQIASDIDTMQKLLLNRVAAPTSVTPTDLANQINKMHIIDGQLNEAMSRATQKLGENHARA